MIIAGSTVREMIMANEDAHNEEDLSDFIDAIRNWLRKESLEQATARVARMTRRPDLAQLAAESIKAKAARFGLLRDPPAIERPDLERWYAGPAADDIYWPSVKAYIAGKWGDGKAIDELDRASTRIVSDFGNPHSANFSFRGLVAGDVQSGKTTNFTAVIAKAADAGYGLFIVLSGTKNKLRKQTQERLNSDLVERDVTSWMWLTNDKLDFSQTGRSNAAQILARSHDQPVIMVVKKNKSRLERLALWLESAPVDMRRRIAALVVDDEADEASINTQKAKNKRAAVNAGILRLISALPKVTFVGYTATPYANFLIDASDKEDLYPRDFIIPLKAGTDYFGYERIFGRERTRFDESDADIDGLDMIRLVGKKEADQVSAISSGKGTVTVNSLASLSEALDWFILATAARNVRGQSGEHSSMLIHTSQRTAVHRLFRRPIEDSRDSLLAAVVANDRSVRQRLESMWTDEQAAVPPDMFELDEIPFESIWAVIPRVLKRVKVVVENSASPEEERLMYGDDPGVFVVIGGDVLSRGLTLEGLVCSYFTRSASAFDTLMQMGRWFGYRRGFEDLPRIWMTAELSSNFYEMGAIDREIRQLIERTYNGTITPSEYAPLMRKHPRLAITSRMKMQGPILEREYSYANRRVQTILFHHKNKTWLHDNLEAAKRLVKQALEVGASRASAGGSQAIVLDGVPVELVLQFLESYNVHENSVDMNRKALTEYIAAERSAGALERWSVAVVQGLKGASAVTLAPGVDARTVVRSRMKGDLAYANIKSLMSHEDTVAGLNVPVPKDSTFDDLMQQRNKLAPNVGLLVLYPIDAMSLPSPRKGLPSRTRVALDAVDTVVGLGMVFPESRSNRERATYIQLQIPQVAVEEPDDPEEDDEGAS